MLKKSKKMTEFLEKVLYLCGKLYLCGNFNKLLIQCTE
jgi:hypothetical protein